MRDDRGSARKRVWDRMRLRKRQGLYVLNTWYPEWREHVDLSVLDMSDHHLCVLGQLPFDYNETLRFLAKSDRWDVMYHFAWSHGLDVSQGDRDEHPEVDPYELLTSMWRRDGSRAAA